MGVAYNELLCAVLLLRSVGGLAVVTGVELSLRVICTASHVAVRVACACFN
jgi:hypothetical protein